MATTFKLSDAAIADTVETLKADAGVQKRWQKNADILRAEGVTSEMMEKDADFRAWFKNHVILLSFTKAEQAIMAKPLNILTDEQKVTRRWVQQQTGARLVKVTTHVRKAEQEEVMTDDERGARRVATLSARLAKDLARWIEKVEKAEKVDFSAVEMVKALKAAAALLKK